MLFGKKKDDLEAYYRLTQTAEDKTYPLLYLVTIGLRTVQKELSAMIETAAKSKNKSVMIAISANEVARGEKMKFKTVNGMQGKKIQGPIELQYYLNEKTSTIQRYGGNISSYAELTLAKKFCDEMGLEERLGTFLYGAIKAPLQGSLARIEILQPLNHFEVGYALTERHKMLDICGYSAITHCFTLTANLKKQD